MLLNPISNCVFIPSNSKFQPVKCVAYITTSGRLSKSIHQVCPSPKKKYLIQQDHTPSKQTREFFSSRTIELILSTSTSRVSNLNILRLSSGTDLNLSARKFDGGAAGVMFVYENVAPRTCLKNRSRAAS